MEEMISKTICKRPKLEKWDDSWIRDLHVEVHNQLSIEASDTVWELVLEERISLMVSRVVGEYKYE